MDLFYTFSIYCCRQVSFLLTDEFEDSDPEDENGYGDKEGNKRRVLLLFKMLITFCNFCSLFDICSYI